MPRQVQRLTVPIILVIMLAGCSACTPKSPTLSPAATRAYTANEIAIRVREFQTATINASDAMQIPQPQARVIVQWCVTTLEILRTTPRGWDATVRESWIKFKPEVVKFPVLAGWATAIDIILGV